MIKKLLISSANFYQPLLREEDTFCHHVFVCVFIFSYSTSASHLSNSWFLLLPYLSLCGSLSLTASLCRCLSFLRETYWMSLLSVSLLAQITRSHSTRRPCQEEDTVFTICVCVWEREYVWMSLCICAYCTHLCVCRSVYVCVCIRMRCSAPFPSTGYVQGQQLCCQDVFKSFLQEHLLCFLSAGWAVPARRCAGVSTDY